eukprot:488844_1
MSTFLNTSQKTWTISIMIICGILFLLVMPIIYKFIKTYSKSTTVNSKTTNHSYHCGLLFLLATILLLLSFIHEYIHFYMGNIGWYRIGTLIKSLLYAIQFYFLLLTLFIRLYSVFHGTVFKLQKHTIRFYVTMYILMPFMMLTAAVIWKYVIIGAIILALTAILTISLVISILILFIYKLIQVYSKHNDDTLIGVITKNTILTFASILFTLISMFAIIIFGDTFWSDIAMIVDLYTNFLSIMLTYDCFNNYYVTICHCMDNKCKIWCQKLVKNQNEEKKLQQQIEMDSTEAVSV